jgi:hypothetical protein
MSTCLIELHYLPNLQYFHTLAKHECVVLEKHEYFVKQSYRSRCIINTAQGPQTLTIPLTDKHGKTLISDVRIDYSQKWLNNHWRTIQSAYANAPFYEYYADSLHTILFKQHPFLFDLNRELLTMCLRWLKFDLRIEESLAYEGTPASDHIDYRNAISTKKTGLHDEAHPNRAYTQVFGNAFVNNLSLIDLVFCTGPKALTYLRDQV